MTTIATDGVSMAADGRQKVCDIVSSDEATKLVRLDDGSIMGFAGSIEDIDRAAAWLNGGNKPKPRLTECQLLVLRPDGSVQQSNEGEDLVSVTRSFAIGSGMMLAIGALDAHATPEQAVGIAAGRDPATGGTITVMFAGKQ